MSTLPLEVVPFATIALAGVGVWAWRLRPLSGPTRAQLSDARSRASVSGRIASGSLSVGVIVPARDEAESLPNLLESLRRLDPAPASVVVVDDHSVDGTGDLARAAGHTVVTPGTLPPGWLGKPWACAAGYAAIRDEGWILFTDADTVHAPDSLARAIDWAEREKLDLVSVMPFHVVRAFWERFQGVFQLLLCIATAAGRRQSRQGDERLFCIGQYLLFRRDAYESIGGHSSVRGRVAEDVAFARAIVERGGRYGLLVDGRSPLLRVRMYPSGLASFVAGWRRNVREGLGSAGVGGVFEVSAVMGWLLGAPLVALQGGFTGNLPLAAVGLVAYLLAVAEIGRRQTLLGNLPLWTAPFYPAFAALFVLVTCLAAADRLRRAPIRWRGRSIRLAPASEPADRSHELPPRNRGVEAMQWMRSFIRGLLTSS